MFKVCGIFLACQVVGFVGAVGLILDGYPLGKRGFFCHYWLDGRIRTRRSF
jgi:hypothetical protein